MERKERYEITVTHCVDVTASDIDDIMTTALEGGISHWCGDVEAVGEMLGETAAEQISRGGELRLYDAETDESWTLDVWGFIKGLQTYLGGAGVSRIDCGQVDAASIDAWDADEIIQCALFGEMVYG